MTTPPKPKLFAKLRTDPKKVAEGVWITHPETGDQFKRRRRWCAEHVRAYEEAIRDYEAEHGEGSSRTPEGGRHVAAVADARGVIIDWKLASNPDHPYDPAEMVLALLDPELRELQVWLDLNIELRNDFHPDHAAGN